MIAFLKGIVWHISEDSLIIDVHGVGYKVHVPMAAFSAIPIRGEEITLHTHMQLREDNCSLFGFTNQDQLDMFYLLLGVNGIGAKMAIAILNTLSPANIIFAVQMDDTETFKTVSGIGKKMAERIVMELKDKCAKLKTSAQAAPSAAPMAGGGQNQAITALIQLGYTAAQAAKMMQAALQELPETATIESIITTALRLAAK